MRQIRGMNNDKVPLDKGVDFLGGGSEREKGGGFLVRTLIEMTLSFFQTVFMSI